MVVGDVESYFNVKPNFDLSWGYDNFLKISYPISQFDLRWPNDLHVTPFLYSNVHNRDYSVYSLHDQLLKTHLEPAHTNIKERLDKVFTRSLTIFTIITICFLFWLQNSPYHIGGHTQPKLTET